MKFVVSLSILLATMPAANAFSVAKSPGAFTARSSRLSVLTEPSTTTVGTINGDDQAEVMSTPSTLTSDREVIEPGRFNEMEMSRTLPLLRRPPALDGSHAGDAGFDPMGFSESQDLYSMQEAEIRHGRLAMLAVVGWPVSEMLGPKFLLQEGGTAPSVLNGFGHSYGISLLGVLAFFGAYGVFEFKTSLRSTATTEFGQMHEKDMEKVWKYGVAGDYNFDPLDLYSKLGDDCYGRKGLRELEIQQGRYAMLGITFFAIFEALTGKPIVEDNMFFHPNALLPFLAFSYFAWSQIYEVSSISEYPVKIQYNKDGEEIIRWTKEKMAQTSRENASTFKSVTGVFGKAGDFLSNLTPE